MHSYLRILLLLIAIVPLVTCQINPSIGSSLTRPANCPPIDPCIAPVLNGTCRYGCLPNYKRACDAYTCLPRLQDDCSNICSSVTCLFGWTCEPLVSTCSYRCQSPGPASCQEQCLSKTCPSAKVCSCTTGTPQCTAPDTDGPVIIKSPSCQERCLQTNCPTAKVCSCQTGSPVCIAPDTDGPIIIKPPPTTCFEKCINFKCPTAKVCECSSSGNPICVAPDVSGPVTTIDLPITLPRSVSTSKCDASAGCLTPWKPISIASNLRTTAVRAGVADQFVVSTSNIVQTSSTQGKATVGFKGATATQRKEAMEKFVTQLLENSSVVGTSSASGSNTVFIIDGQQSVSVTEAMMMTQTCDDGQEIAVDQVCPIGGTAQDDLIIPATTTSNSSSGSSFSLWIIGVAAGVVLVAIIAAAVVYRRRKVAATVSRMDVANAV